MDWPWANFSQEEMRCRETGELRIDPDFMDRLQRLRVRFGKPMRVTSGFRSPYHSLERGKEHRGAHTYGCAVDVAVIGADAYRLVQLALEAGFNGIGVSQRAGVPRFVHLDTLPGGMPFLPRPAIWSY